MENKGGELLMKIVSSIFSNAKIQEDINNEENGSTFNGCYA